MRTLDRLLFSDVRRMWSQGLALCAVLACGVGTFVMSTSTHRSLEVTQRTYYDDYHFADVFAQLTRAPNGLARRLAEVPGVERVETRVVRELILDLPNLIEPASGRLVSIPDDVRGSLNGLYLRRGRLPNPARRGEVVASELFAEANRLEPGDQLDVIMGGRKERLRVVGIGLSPEYIYAVQPGQFLPDNRRFGIFWMPYRQMAAAFNMEGAFNDVSLTLSPNASEPEVIAAVDRLLERYGCRGAYGREEQPSHRRVADEMLQLRSMSIVMPFLFLAVSTFLFNLVLSRIVHQQQEQIATLRAFGYRASEVGLHYAKLLLVLICVGVVAGTAVGVWLSRGMAENYAFFFRFPELHFVVAWDQIVVACLLSVATATLGSASAVRRAMRLPPAVAMRPEVPQVYRPALVERIGLRRFLTPVALLVFRRLERNKVLTGLSVLGMAMGLAILVLGSFLEDTVDFMMEALFERAQRQDVTLTFIEPISAGGIYDVQHLPGVTAAERFRATSVRLVHGRNSRRMALMGLEPQPQLFRLLDSQGNEVILAEQGLTISQKLSELLNVSAGDEVEVEFLEEERPNRQVRISNVFPDYTEPAAYMSRRALARLLQEGDQLSGAFLAVDSRQMPQLQAAVKETPAVAGITVKNAAKESFEHTIAENLRQMRSVNAIFAAIIAFGVIYNCALITLAERSRDLASLRVLGFTRGEVSTVLLGELAVITLLALPVGLPIGYALSYVTTIVMDTETHRFPLVIQRATFAYATTMILAAAGVSAMIVRQMLDRLDLVAVLKVKE